MWLHSNVHLFEVEGDTWWCPIFSTSSSMFGVRLWAEEILRIEWRCSAVSRLLCDVLFKFIKENSCSHRYVLPNIDNVWAAWMRSWGIVSGRKRANSAAPTAAYFALSASLHWRSINSIWRFGGELSTSTANGLPSSSNLLFCASKSANRRRKSAASIPILSANCALGNADYTLSVPPHFLHTEDTQVFQLPPWTNTPTPTLFETPGSQCPPSVLPFLMGIWKLILLWCWQLLCQ